MNLTNLSTNKKSRAQINKENYLKNKEKIKAQQKERYQQLKEQRDKELAEYYSAQRIQVLLPLKDYINLNPVNKKSWLDFSSSLQELAKGGIADIVEIQELIRLGQDLVSSYYQQTKLEIAKGKNWNKLSDKQQKKLITYWSQERLRTKLDLLTETEKLDQQSIPYQQEVELLKFHEQRGKVNCDCYNCVESKEIEASVEKKLLSKVKVEKLRAECPECSSIRVLDEEEGVCKACLKNYGE